MKFQILRSQYPDFETFVDISFQNIFEFEDEVLDFESEDPDFETIEDMATTKNGKQFDG